LLRRSAAVSWILMSMPGAVPFTPRGLHKLAKEGLVCLMESCNLQERLAVSAREVAAPRSLSACTGPARRDAAGCWCCSRGTQ
jgi:hypothetical protein